MGLETALLQAACDYANEKEAELTHYADNWTAQVSELANRLIVVTRERDEARAALAQIRQEANDVEEALAAKQAARKSHPGKQG